MIRGRDADPALQMHALDAARGARMSPTLLGRVVRADARTVQVEFLEGPDTGTVRPCALRGRLFEERGPAKNPVTVGDLVDIGLEGDLPGVEAVRPRRNYLSRVASTHDPRAQILFANVDQLLVISSIVQPKFSSNRADRILAACRWHRIPAVLVLNKIDLAEPDDVQALRASYAGAEIEVLETSARAGVGIEELRARLQGKVSALNGGSGVGKSSLLNALAPALALKTGKISKYWEQGKHTTSSSQMLRLGPDTLVIDTPGIRVFKLHQATRGDLRGLFPEFAPFERKCHLPDCSHDHEPECAVFAAVERGQIPPTRYASYVEMVDELGGKSREDEQDLEEQE